jgi:hypothetical protein
MTSYTIVNGKLVKRPVSDAAKTLAELLKKVS